MFLGNSGFDPHKRLDLEDACVAFERSVDACENAERTFADAVLLSQDLIKMFNSCKFAYIARYHAKEDLNAAIQAIKDMRPRLVLFSKIKMLKSWLICLL